MDQIRGGVMILFGALALYRGWTLHAGEHALLAYALGVLSLAIGVWRITRKPARPLL